MKELEEWVIGSDKKPTIYLYDNTGDALLINQLSAYGIRLFQLKRRYNRLLWGKHKWVFRQPEIVNIGDSSFDVVLDASINTVAGVVRGRIYTIWTDEDFTDSDFDDIGEEIIMYNSVNP